MSNEFCVHCKATAEQIKKDPHTFHPKGDPPSPAHTPVVEQVENVANCTLHFLLRTCESIFGETLRLCNVGDGGYSREDHEKYIRSLGISGFRLYGDINSIDQDKKPTLPWSSLSGAQWKKIIFSFDLSRVYSGDRLKLARILITLYSKITFAIERKVGAIGDLTGKQIRVLSLVMINVFKSLYGKYPGARYFHYLTNHMVETKDELAKEGRSLGEISTASSELLQKGGKTHLRRASNHRKDAVVQVFCRANRVRAATIAIKKIIGSGAANLMVNNQDISRKRDKETRRHAALMVGHQCAMRTISKSWFEKFLKNMKQSNQLSAADMDGIGNIEELLLCPFCHILGQQTGSKPPLTRTTFQLLTPLQELPWCNSEDAESYYPTEAEEIEDSEDYVTDSEDGFSESEDSNVEDDM